MRDTYSAILTAGRKVDAEVMSQLRYLLFSTILTESFMFPQSPLVYLRSLLNTRQALIIIYN